ncbi:MAG: hypothetical protein IPO21_17935 [Bacteroidales bacterium]|nr:hypothetical protein [Bacteroidales bacterium]
MYSNKHLNIRCIALFAVLFTATYCLHAQTSVGINTTNPNTHAVLELVSPTNNQGFLAPKMTTVQRTNASLISSLSITENGLLVYDTDENTFYYWLNPSWQKVSSGDLKTLVEVLIAGNSAGNNRIIDLADPINNQDAVTKIYLDNISSNLLTQIQNLDARVTNIEGDITDIYDSITNITNNGAGLPLQTGNGGKFLSTNGTTAFWEIVPASSDMNKSDYDTDNNNIVDNADYDNTTSGLSATTTQAAVDEIDTRVDTNEGDITNLDNRVTTVEGDVAAIDARVTTNEGDITNLDNRVTNIEGDITDIFDSITEINLNIDTIKGDIINIINNGAGLPLQTGNTGRYLSTDGTTASWEVVPPSSDMNKSDYDTDNNNIVDNADYDNTTSGLSATTTQAAVDEIDTRVDTNEGDITAIDARVTTNEGDITNLENRVTTVEGDITTIEGDITTIEGDISTIEGDITTIEGDISTIEGDITTIEGDITTIEGDITTIEGDITAIDARVTANEGDITDITNILNNGTFKLADGNIFIGAANDTAHAVIVNGDASLANDGTLTITDGAISPEKIAGISLASIAGSSGQVLVSNADGTFRWENKLSGGMSDDLSGAHIWVGNGAIPSKAVAVNPTGDVEIAIDGTTTIQADAVGSAEIAADAVTASEIATGAVATAEILDGTIQDIDLDIPAVGTNGQILTSDGTGGFAWISQNGLTSLPELTDVNDAATTTNGNVLVANGTQWNSVAQSGDVIISNAGNAQIQADAVGSAEIAADAVTATEIATDAVSSPEIAADAVTASEIATGAVATAEILDGTIQDIDLDIPAVGTNGQILTSDGTGGFAWISQNGLTSLPELTDVNDAATTTNGNVLVANGTQWNSVAQSGDVIISNAGNAQIQADAVGSAEIATDAVTATEIAADAVTASEIASGAVATAEILDGTIQDIDLGLTSTLTFEGSTADAFETVVSITNPTADNTITIQDASGTIAFTSQLPTAANPTGTVGLAGVNGTATTFMRSDAAPALSQAIIPTWTGAHTWSALGTFNLGLNASGNAVNLNNNSNFPVNIGTGTSTGTVTIGNGANVVNLPALTASKVVFTDASKNLTTTGTIAVDQGGTGQSTYTNGQLLIGNTTGNTLTKATLTGTANQVTITNGNGSITLATPQDIATSSSPTFTGLNLSGLTASKVIFTDASKNISTTGTIAVDQGGTGLAAYTVGDLIFASGATALSKLADVAAGNALISGGIGVAPSWGKISLTSHISGILPIANGGTNSNAVLNNNRIMISSGGSIVENAALTNGQLLVGSTGAAPAAATLTGTANQVTITNGAGTITLATPQDIATTSSPTFAGLNLSGLTASNVIFTDGSKNLSSSGTIAVNQGGTGQSTYTNGQLLIGNTTGNTLTKATLTGTANQVTVTNGNGSITLATPQDIATSSSPTFTGLNLNGLAASKVLFTDGSKNLTTAGTIAVDQGGTGLAAYTVGDLIFASGATTLSKLADIAAGSALISGGVGVAPSWGKISLTSHISGILPIANGGTNSNTALNNNRIMISSGGSIVENTALTNGQLLVGSTGAAPAAATLTGTANQVTITNGAGTITLATPQDIATTSSPTFTGLNLSGLTASNVIFTDGSKNLSSSGTIAVNQGGTGQSTYTNGQLLIGNTTGNTLTKATLTGTANQVTVTNGNGSITLATPQDIATSSSPTFTGLNLSGLAASKVLFTDASKNISTSGNCS